MKKEIKTPIYLEYVKKYEKYGINPKRLEYMENVSKKRHKSDMGIDLETYIRCNLYFDILSNLYKHIEELPQANQYKMLVIKHSKELVKYLTKEELDILYEDVLEQVKEDYIRLETLGSYIIRLYKNNIIDYVNENYNTNFKKVKAEDYKIMNLK